MSLEDDLKTLIDMDLGPVSDPKRQKRVKYFTLSEQHLLEVLRGALVIDWGDLPDDAYVWRVGSFDPIRLGITVYVASSEFDPVPDAEIVPCLGPLTFKSAKPAATRSHRTPGDALTAAQPDLSTNPPTEPP